MLFCCLVHAAARGGRMRWRAPGYGGINRRRGSEQEGRRRSGDLSWFTDATTELNSIALSHSFLSPFVFPLLELSCQFPSSPSSPSVPLSLYLCNATPTCDVLVRYMSGFRIVAGTDRHVQSLRRPWDAVGQWLNQSVSAVSHLAARTPVIPSSVARPPSPVPLSLSLSPSRPSICEIRRIQHRLERTDWTKESLPSYGAISQCFQFSSAQHTHRISWQCV